MFDKLQHHNQKQQLLLLHQQRTYLVQFKECVCVRVCVFRVSFKLRTLFVVTFALWVFPFVQTTFMLFVQWTIKIEIEFLESFNYRKIFVWWSHNNNTITRKNEENPMVETKREILRKLISFRMMQWNYFVRVHWELHFFRFFVYWKLENC